MQPSKYARIRRIIDSSHSPLVTFLAAMTLVLTALPPRPAEAIAGENICLSFRAFYVRDLSGNIDSDSAPDFYLDANGAKSEVRTGGTWGRRGGPPIWEEIIHCDRSFKTVDFSISLWDDDDFMNGDDDKVDIYGGDGKSIRLRVIPYLRTREAHTIAATLLDARDGSDWPDDVPGWGDWSFYAVAVPSSDSQPDYREWSTPRILAEGHDDDRAVIEFQLVLNAVE